MFSELRHCEHDGLRKVSACVYCAHCLSLHHAVALELSGSYRIVSCLEDLHTLHFRNLHFSQEIGFSSMETSVLQSQRIHTPLILLQRCKEASRLGGSPLRCGDRNSAGLGLGLMSCFCCKKN